MLKRVLAGVLRSRAAAGWLVFAPAVGLLLYLASAVPWQGMDPATADLALVPPATADYGVWSLTPPAGVTVEPTAVQNESLFDLLLPSLADLLGPEPGDDRRQPEASPTSSPTPDPLQPTAVVPPAAGGLAPALTPTLPPVVNPASTTVQPASETPFLPPATTAPVIPTLVVVPAASPTIALPTVVVPTLAPSATAVPPTSTIPSTQTWTPTTVFVPTATALPPTAAPPTNTPVPLPTHTPVPLPTDTPVPPPTFTTAPPADPIITICHRPPGNPDNARTQQITLSQWPEHAAHGDSLGPCP